MPWTTLCNIDELTEGKGKYVEIGGFQLAVFLVSGQVHAIDNNCPHAGGNLSDGKIENGCAICPRHSWPFRLDNGQMRNAPGIAVTHYPIRQHPHDGKTLVQAELPIY